MCGICGFIDPRADKPNGEIKALAGAMAGTMRHRGPDDSGVWAEAADGAALGHRRLAIIDLSPTGRQPMASHDERWIMVYNGETYNFQEVRKLLEKQYGIMPWRGSSDSEVVLEGVARWGVEKTLSALNGMLAAAWWDRKERKLFLARDRLGKKPLYYAWQNGVFLFASELKALRAHPAFTAGVDRGALALYLRHNYIPAPHSIYWGVKKLPPGTWLEINPARPGDTPPPRAYWSAQEAVERGAAHHGLVAEADAAEELEALLRGAVKQRMISDVPLGAFLSGGVDSSLITALMQDQSARPVKTFSIGFPEESFDEAPYARAVAQHLGCDHTEVYVTWQDALKVVDKLPSIYDEPFSDSSQIPTYLISDIARQKVTVVLSGDAGDELFCGYDRYFLSHQIWSGAQRLPAALKSAGARILRTAPPQALDNLFRKLAWLLPRQMNWKNPGERAHDLAAILNAGSFEAFYRGMVSHEKNPERIVRDSREPPTALTNPQDWTGLDDVRERMMYLDLVSYLPDDILVKVDRASMAVSLETRTPLLDYRLVELAWRLPLTMKIQGAEGKSILRRILYKYVPRGLIERPKMGFGVPLESWLRGPLRPWAEALLAPQRIKDEGFFNADAVSLRWRELQEGKRAWHYYLWDVLMFQAWLEEQGK